LRAWLGSIVLRECDGSTRTERLVLEQVVMNAANVDTEFDGVIADNFGPVVHAIDVVSARIHGSEAEYPNNGVVVLPGVKSDIMMPTCPW